MIKAKIITEKDVDYIEERFKEVFVTQEMFKQYRSELFDKLDQILGEVDAGRQADAIITS